MKGAAITFSANAKIIIDMYVVFVSVTVALLWALRFLQKWRGSAQPCIIIRVLLKYTKLTFTMITPL